MTAIFSRPQCVKHVNGRQPLAQVTAGHLPGAIPLLEPMLNLLIETINEIRN